MTQVNKDQFEIPNAISIDSSVAQITAVENSTEFITVAPNDVIVRENYNSDKEDPEEILESEDNINNPEDTISFSINKATAGAALVGASVGCLFGPVASILLASAAAYATTVKTRIRVGNASRKIGSAAYDKITSIRSNKASAGAAIGGGFAGCLCGPVGMILGASLAAYASTRDDRVGEISRTAGSNIYDKISSWKNSIEQNLNKKPDE